MLRKSKLNRIAIAVAMSVGMSTAAMAQETSSSIRGTITTPLGDAAANTTIVITHEPTGQTRTIRTNETGTFFARGLRVGGPYKVLIDSDQFRDQEVTGLFLQLGEVERLSAQLEDEAIENIVVTASAPAFTSSAGSSYFGEQSIKTAASLTRDIKDVVRSNPLVTILPGDEAALTIAGSNPRFNSITVDGISQNDDFGLNGGGYPTQRSPLPFDALEQVTVDVVPFDAKVSGFSGGLVNAVFKSGTNEFTGGVFYEKQSDHWAGTPIDNEGERFPVEFSEETWGFNVGGPIIKDKLFFYGTYEFYEAPQSLEWGAAGSGRANETDATLDEVATVQRIAREVYGLTDEQIGSPDGSPVEEDEKWVIKLDWNINDYHRAAFTYQYNEGNRTRNTTNSEGELRLSSHWYNTTETLDNYTFKLYSDWSDSFSTEASITQKEVANRQQSFGDIADVTINNLPSGGRIAFGSDQFRHANILDTETFIVKLDATYLWGDHNIEFGVEYQELSIQNLFVPSSKGVLEFDSLEDFENRIADYTYSNGIGNDPFAVGADFDREQLSLYVQNSWDFNDDLELSFGLRYERLSSSDKPPFNVNSQLRTGLDNTENLDGVDIILPRFGFKYYVNEDLSIRGGIGRFAGGQPNVWISNAYSENGAFNGFYSEDGIEVTPGSIAGIFPDASAALASGQSNGNVSFTDPDFEIPSDWRYQIAADYLLDIPFLGEDYAWTTEYLYIDRQDAAFWFDRSLPTGTLLADGQRVIYADDDNRYDLMLSNTSDGGRSKILSTTLSKNWDNGVSFSASYTNQDITESNSGTSSTARSNYRFSDGINRNFPDSHLGTAAFQIEHRFVMNLGFNTEVFEGYETNINLFWERRSGEPVSYTTNFDRSVLTSDVFDDEGNRTVIGLSPEFTSGDYLSYIPTAGDSAVVYDGVSESDLLAAIEAAGLSGYAGGYAPKGSSTTPWVTNVDLSVFQEIPGLVDGHKGTLYFVMDNVLNFFDKSQGKVYDSRFNTLRLYDVDSITADGQYVIDRIRDDGFDFNTDRSSWRLKIGVRYDF